MVVMVVVVATVVVVVMVMAVAAVVVMVMVAAAVVVVIVMVAVAMVMVMVTVMVAERAGSPQIRSPRRQTSVRRPRQCSLGRRQLPSPPCTSSGRRFGGSDARDQVELEPAPATTPPHSPPWRRATVSRQP